jgi:hypothetical protein
MELDLDEMINGDEYKINEEQIKNNACEGCSYRK